jgi:hypothetical protein
MRRGGAPSDGVVLKWGGANHDNANDLFRSLCSPASAALKGGSTYHSLVFS